MKEIELFSGAGLGSYLQKLDALLQDGIEKATNLEKQKQERDANPCGFYLSAIADLCECRTDELNYVQKDSKSPKRKLRNFAVNEIVRQANGNLATPNYLESKRAEQQVYIYCGNRWVAADHTLMIEFSKVSCSKIGFDDEYVEDHSFISDVMQDIAFRHVKSLTQKVIHGAVLINLQNGTMEIHENGSHKWRGHQRDDNFHYVLPYAYDPKAECPMFQKFLDEVLPEKEAQQFLAEYIGFCFTHGIKVEKTLFLYGQGSNGKSVLLDILTKLFGDENVSHVTLSDLTTDDNKRVQTQYKLLNISTESSDKLDPSILKTMVSGEPVSVKVLYQNSGVMYQYAKLITSFNDLPRPEDTHGFYRRVTILPFNVTIPMEKRDVNLAKKIIETELPGIFNWVLEGLNRFLANNYQFTKSPICEQAMEHYKLSSNSVRLFISEVCEPDDTNRILGKNLFEAYKRFCLENNLKSFGLQKFYKKVEALGYHLHKSSNNTTYVNIKCNYDDQI